MKFKWYRRVGIALAIFVCALGLSYYVFSPRESIVNYTVSRDKQFILSLFDKDWYWLSGYSREESDTDLFLEKMSPSPEPKDAGKLIIKVMYASRKPVGFVAYYMESKTAGKILFIDVAHEFRRQHYGRVLLDYAVDQLCANGARIVRLVTRPQNIPAQSLYRSAGFREYARTDVYSFFERRCLR